MIRSPIARLYAISAVAAMYQREVAAHPGSAIPQQEPEHSMPSCAKSWSFRCRRRIRRMAVRIKRMRCPSIQLDVCLNEVAWSENECGVDAHARSAPGSDPSLTGF